MVRAEQSTTRRAGDDHTRGPPPQTAENYFLRQCWAVLRYSHEYLSVTVVATPPDSKYFWGL